MEVRRNGDTDPLEQYVWGLRHIDAPVCRWFDEDTDGQNVVQHYYTGDANFNVTALVDESGTVLERVVYDPYGKPTFYDSDWTNPSSTSAHANAILYCGYYYDTETGLYHVRHRTYHPPLGRWLQRDPVGYADGMNLYEYVISVPNMFAGALGLKVRTTSRNKYPDEASPLLGAGGYIGLGASIEGQSIMHFEDCCTEGGQLIEKGYVKITIEVMVHAGLGIGVEIGGIGAVAKGAGLSVLYRFGSETTTCGQPPDRYTYEREENLIDARVNPSVFHGPLSAGYTGGTRVYLRFMGAVGGGEPLVIKCEICAETGASWGVQTGNKRKSVEDPHTHRGCATIVHIRR